MTTRIFKNLANNRKIVNTIQHLKDKLLESKKEVEIYIGCDSQNHGNDTVYVSVIVLHYEKQGGHVIYCKETVPRIKDQFTRLWREVEISIEVAEYLKENGIKAPKHIDVDMNPDPQYRSNQSVYAAMGYIESYGYSARCKPNALAASYAADRMCK